MKRLLLFVLLAGNWECTRLAVMKEGIKQPALEDFHSLSAFLLEKQIDTSELICLKDTAALHWVYHKKIALPGSRFFNRNGELVDYRESPEDCNGKVAEFIKKAESINQLTPVSGEHLGQYVKNLVYTHNGQSFQLENAPYDAYLVIYWVKYLGNVNKTKVFDWLALADEARRRGVNIRVIKINADYQRAWGLTKDDLPHFDYY